MDEPIDELISYADHTHGCMVAAGHDECTCGYDDAEGKAQAAWEALKAENAHLAGALRAVGALIWPIGSWATIGEAVPMVSNALDLIDAALSPQEQLK